MKIVNNRGEFYKEPTRKIKLDMYVPQGRARFSKYEIAKIDRFLEYMRTNSPEDTTNEEYIQDVANIVFDPGSFYNDETEQYEYYDDDLFEDAKEFAIKEWKKEINIS